MHGLAHIGANAPRLLQRLTRTRQPSEACPFNAFSSTLSKTLGGKVGMEVAAYCRAKPQWLATFSPCRPVGVQNKCPRSDVRRFTPKMSDLLSALQSHLKQSKRPAISTSHGSGRSWRFRNTAPLEMLREYHMRGISGLGFSIPQFHTDFAAEELTCGPRRLRKSCIDLPSSSVFAHWLRIFISLFSRTLTGIPRQAIC